MTAVSARADDLIPIDASVEKAKLQKHFGRSDIFFFLVCTLVGIDGLGALSSQGGAAFTWLLVSLALFAVPSSMLLAELGATFTDEGGPYVWVRQAFGHLAGAVNNFFYWVTNPVWMGGTLVGVALSGLATFFNGGRDYSTLTQLLFGVPFIWLGVLFAVLSFRVGKWVATVGAFARFALLGLFSVVVVVYGLQNGFEGLGVGDFKPTYSTFVALVPLILFSLVGFELPSAAGEEMENAKEDVPAGIAKSVIATGLLYGLPVLGILLVLPQSQVSGLAGFPDAIRLSLSVFGEGAATPLGWVVALLIVIIAFTSGLTWIMGSDRTLAVSCYDGAGPRSLGTFSERFGTPVRVNILSGLVSTAVLVSTLLITKGDAAKFFGVALSLAISTTLMSYLGIFPAAWKLRSRRPADDDAYRAPMLPLLTILSVGFIVFCTVQLLFPGLGDQWFGPDYAADGWKPEERVTYLVTELVPLLFFTAIAVAFWAAGKKHRESVAIPG